MSTKLIMVLILQEMYVRSLCCTHQTYTVLYVTQILIKLKKYASFLYITFQFCCLHA